MSSPPPLRTLVDLFNEHTPYRCVAEDAGARITVNDLDVWFPEEQARDLLWRILGAHGICRVSRRSPRIYRVDPKSASSPAGGSIKAYAGEGSATTSNQNESIAATRLRNSS